MKLLSLICLTLLLVLDGFNYVASYYRGYGETWPLPCQVYAMCIWPFIFLVFIGAWLFSLFNGKNRRWTTTIVLLFVALIFIQYKCLSAPGYMAVYGLRDHVMKECSLNDLRQFAHEVDKAGLIKKSSGVDPAYISGLTNQQKEVYAQLRDKYPFLHYWEDGRILHGPSIVSLGRDGVVIFEFGGALAGHCGCSISIDGKKNDPDTGGKTLPVSNDIYFFATSD